MRARSGLLPATVPWKQAEVQVRGGVTTESMTLYFRDALECFKFLFGNPLFSNNMEYTPRREFTSDERPERLYNEMMTGDLAWNLQVGVSQNIYYNS